ncbi:MAG: Ribonuclease VapC [Pedosphaera sp.]|nr:Ribonuclease VapC [Pedosphaera sp.]
MKYLLDVNILIGAIWRDQAAHRKVMAWLAGKEVVLCPLSELGFLRISTNNKVMGASMDRTRELLKKFAADIKADRIPADLDALDSHPRTSDQVTDHYLADLAAKHGLKLATLDEQLKHSSAELIV